MQFIRLNILLLLVPLGLGCARVVVTRENGNTSSIKVEPFVGLSPKPAGKAPNVASQSQSIAQMEEAVRKGINAERQKRGLKPLSSNEKLRLVARDYSRRMNREGFFSHYDKAGRSVADRVRGAGQSYRLVGENLFTSTNAPDPAAASIKGWMDSPGHRANILRPEFTQTGLGIWKNGTTYHFTQVFLRPG